MRIHRRLCSCCDNDGFPGDQALSPVVVVHQVQPQCVGIDKGSRRRKKVDVIAAQLMPCDVDFVPDHLIGAEHQVVDGDVLFDGVGGAVE